MPQEPELKGFIQTEHPRSAVQEPGRSGKGRWLIPDKSSRIPVQNLNSGSIVNSQIPLKGGLYPIRTVAELTGINPVTLRAWERRYGLIKPERTPKGHRLYTDQHIALIRQIMDLVDRGISIGQVKNMLDREGTGQPATLPLTSQASGDPWAEYRQRMLNAISLFDDIYLDATYNDCLSLYPFELVTRLLVAPLLREIRDRGISQPPGDAEARFLRTYLRNKLGARFHHQSTQSRGLRLVGACLPGEHSEVELLVFSLSALTRGYRIVLLGPDMPLDGLAFAAEHSRARGIVLFGSMEPTRALLNTHLPSFARQSPVPVFVGGSIADEYSDPIRGAGCIPLAEGIADAVLQIDEALSGAPGKS